MCVPKTCDHIHIKIKMPHPSQEPPASSKAPNDDLKDMDVLCTFKIKIESWNLDHGCVKDQWPYPNQDQDANSSQESPASSKALNQDFKDMDVLCTFKIKIESHNLDHGCTSYHIYIRIRMAIPNLEPQAFSEAPNEDLKDMAVLFTFKIKVESHNLEPEWIKDQWPYPNQDQNVKSQSGSYRILQRPKWGLKGHECSLHLQNQDRQPKLGSWVYPKPVTISKSRSRYKTTVRNPQYPPKPQART